MSKRRESIRRILIFLFLIVKVYFHVICIMIKTLNRIKTFPWILKFRINNKMILMRSTTTKLIQLYFYFWLYCIHLLSVKYSEKQRQQRNKMWQVLIDKKEKYDLIVTFPPIVYFSLSSQIIAIVFQKWREILFEEKLSVSVLIIFQCSFCCVLLS